MIGPPCFICNSKQRLKGHVVCEDCHCVEKCVRCVRATDLSERIKKRRRTIEKKRSTI